MNWIEFYFVFFQYSCVLLIESCLNANNTHTHAKQKILRPKVNTQANGWKQGISISAWHILSIFYCLNHLLVWWWYNFLKIIIIETGTLYNSIFFRNLTKLVDTKSFIEKKMLFFSTDNCFYTPLLYILLLLSYYSFFYNEMHEFFPHESRG